MCLSSYLNLYSAQPKSVKCPCVNDTCPQFSPEQCLVNTQQVHSHANPPTLHCTLYCTTHCTLYTVHCTLHTALHCTELYNVYCTVECSLHCTIHHAVNSTLHTVLNFTLFDVSVLGRDKGYTVKNSPSPGRVPKGDAPGNSQRQRAIFTIYP